MNTPMITWCLIVALIILIAARQIVKSIHQHMRLKHAVALRATAQRRHHHLIENGGEWEMLYVPGDTNGRDEHRYDEYEAEYDSDYLTNR